MHGNAGDDGGYGDDRERDVGECVVGRGLSRLAEFDERDDEGEGPEDRDR